MKKILMMLAMVLVLIGCGSANTGNSDNETEKSYKAGVASYTTVSAKDVTDGAGSAEVITTYAAVVVDAEGVIKYVHFDTAQNKAAIDGEGKITIAAADTKRELGENYGMSTYAKTNEWDKQVAHLENYMVGKNIADVVAMELDGAFHSVDADVLSGCTIGLNEFVMSLEKASQNLVEVTGAVHAYAGSDTTVSAKDVTDGAGSAEVVTTFGLVLTDAEDKVVFASFDTAQNKAAIDGEGKVAIEAASTKKELGDNYGMGKYAANGEWYKQINHLESTMIGKTVAEFTGAALDDAGKSLDADVLSGCTVHVSEFVEVVNSSFKSEMK